jgi:uncharacterized membrane protein
MFLIFVLLAAVAVLLFLQMRRSGSSPLLARLSPAPTVPPASVRPSDAEAILKLRYARGEIGRAEYLSMAADLGIAGSAPGDPLAPAANSPVTNEGETGQKPQA